MYDDNNDGGMREYQERGQQEHQEKGMNVYQAICAVAKDMASEGISKGRKNQQQGYAFRGIDDVYNALAPRLASHGLVILPRMIGRTVTERETAKGGVLFYVVVEAEFDFVSANDGSRHTIKTYGEAMDSGDKATNKAMSAAYKYAAMQAFCIPTQGDNDADLHTHDVAPKRKEAPRKTVNMEDAMIALREAPNYEALKSMFTDMWNSATAEQRTEIKRCYDTRKGEFLGEQA